MPRSQGPRPPSDPISHPGNGSWLSAPPHLASLPPVDEVCCILARVLNRLQATTAGEAS